MIAFLSSTIYTKLDELALVPTPHSLVVRASSFAIANGTQDWLYTQINPSEVEGIVLGEFRAIPWSNYTKR